MFTLRLYHSGWFLWPVCFYGLGGRWICWFAYFQVGTQGPFSKIERLAGCLMRSDSSLYGDPPAMERTRDEQAADARLGLPHFKWKQPSDTAKRLPLGFLITSEGRLPGHHLSMVLTAGLMHYTLNPYGGLWHGGCLAGWEVGGGQKFSWSPSHSWRMWDGDSPSDTIHSAPLHLVLSVGGWGGWRGAADEPNSRRMWGESLRAPSVIYKAGLPDSWLDAQDMCEYLPEMLILYFCLTNNNKDKSHFSAG